MNGVSVPESKKRKKRGSSAAHAPGVVKKKGPSPVWLAPLMLAMFGIGVLWLVVFYITQPNMPFVAGLGNGNLVVGFAFIIAGFGLSTQWR